MASSPADILLVLLLIVCVVVLVIMWIKNRRLKKNIKKLKQGKNPLSLVDKILVALKIKEPPRPPHGGFKEGDVNIRVW
jgi:hypothetical protein